MTKEEIKLFENFLKQKNVLNVFFNIYSQNRMMVNPVDCDEYLLKARADRVIPLAFTYPRSVYDKDFWLKIHQEWVTMLQEAKAQHVEKDLMEQLDLDFVDLEHRASSCIPMNCCSVMNERNHRLALNHEHSLEVISKGFTRMSLARSQSTGGVVLMFNKLKGLRIRTYGHDKMSNVVVNSVDLCEKLERMLGLEPSPERTLLKCNMLTASKDYVVFQISL